MVKFKNAFTLVETLVSMLIITTIAIASVSVISKAKPRIESITIRGQYACWYWNQEAADDAGLGSITGIGEGTLVQWYFDERSPRTDKPEINPIREDGSVGCELKFTQRPAQFYILAAGAGAANKHAQVTTAYTQTISDTQMIDIGKATTGFLETKVSLGESNAVIAHGPDPTYENAYPGNISSCKIVYDPTGVINSCTVSKNDTSYQVDLNKTGGKSIVQFNQLETIDWTTGTANFNSLSEQQARSRSNSHNRVYRVRTGEMQDVEFNFTFEDPSHIPTKNLLGYENNLNNGYSDSASSKMAKIIENISPRRQSQLTDLIGKLNAGAPEHNGAVLILW